MDVGEEGVRGPPSHLFDGVTIVPVKFECHCTTGPEGVAADSTGVEALLGKAQVQHSIFDSFADVRDVDVVFGAVFESKTRSSSSSMQEQKLVTLTSSSDMT